MNYVKAFGIQLTDTTLNPRVIAVGLQKIVKNIACYKAQLYLFVQWAVTYKSCIFFPHICISFLWSLEWTAIITVNGFNQLVFLVGGEMFSVKVGN